jgi:hypothetical protein
MAAKTDFFPLFMHIPKTAGTTLHYVLRRQYRKRLQTFYTTESLKKPVLAANTAAAIGHFRYNFASKLPAKNYAFGTFLRHPFSQVFSHYHFIKSNQNGNHAAFANFSLEKFVAHPFGNNFQVRSICGIEEIDDDARVLETAKTHLKQFFFVGITEEFDEGLLVLQKKMGWLKKPYYLRGTVQDYKTQISESDKAIIEKSNALDMALYEFGITLWQQQKNAAQIDARQLQKFKMRNHWYSLLAAKWSKIKQRVAE